MRRFLPLVALLAALALAASAEGKTLFVVRGKGWGHGVGMSQYGALGKAQRGVGYRDILRFYYQGTHVAESGQRHVRVLLTSNRSSVRISSAAGFKVGKKRLAAGSYRVKSTADGRVRIVGVRAFSDPVTASPGNAPLALNGLRYRGKLRLWVRSGRIAVVNVVSMQGYLFSVVPREMPASFAKGALRAQAVAARSYAVRASRASWYDLYPDTRDQVYGGLDQPAPGLGEHPRTTAAVKATAREVVRYGDAVAQTFFSSSNGGVEAASVDTWGGDPGYLNSRRDRDDNVAANPNRNWRVRFSGRELGNRLGTPTPRDAVVTSRASGRVRALRLSGPWGSEVVSDHTSLRSPEYWRWPSTLGLKSGRFWVGVQAIRAKPSSVRCREPVRLRVFAHGVGSISVEQRPDGSSTWERIALRKIDSRHWRATRHPCTSMNYRVVSARATGPRIHVSVSPSIAFDASQQPDGLDGRVSPATAGGLVTVERREAGAWTPVAHAVVAADGTFATDFSVSEGVYRATVAPPSPGGFLPGYTRRLTVVFG